MSLQIALHVQVIVSQVHSVGENSRNLRASVANLQVPNLGVRFSSCMASARDPQGTSERFGFSGFEKGWE